MQKLPKSTKTYTKKNSKKIRKCQKVPKRVKTCKNKKSTKKCQKVPKKFQKGTKKNTKKVYESVENFGGGEVPKKNSKCQKKVPIAAKKYPKKRRSKKEEEEKKVCKKNCQKVPNSSIKLQKW